MFYSHQLLARKAPLGQIWMAATLHAKINRRSLHKLDIIKICEEILHPRVPMALRLSSILMGGVVIVYEHKVKLLYEDVNRLLVEINAAWRVKPTAPDQTLLSRSRAQAKYEKVTLPDVLVEEAEMEQLVGLRFDAVNLMTMKLDEVDDTYINLDPSNADQPQHHHQADPVNITLVEDFGSSMAEADLYNRFERFDIDGDEEDPMFNFTQEVPTMIPSPPQHGMAPSPPQHDKPQVNEDTGVHAKEQNEKISEAEEQEEEKTEHCVQVEMNEQGAPRQRPATRRKARAPAIHPTLDEEHLIILGGIYQDWLADCSNLVKKRRSIRIKLQLHPTRPGKVSKLMNLPPLSLLNGTEIYYPAELLELWQNCKETNIGKSSSGGSSSRQAPNPVGEDPPSHSPPRGLFPESVPVYDMGDLHSQNEPKYESIEKLRKNLENMEVHCESSRSMGNFESPRSPVVLTAGSNPSSGSGNFIPPLDPEVTLPNARSKRRQWSSSANSLGNLDVVHEEQTGRDPKQRRLSEVGPSPDFELLVETAHTQTQTPHPVSKEPAVDQITQSIHSHLKIHFDTPGAPQSESLEQLTSGATRGRAARFFYQTFLATLDIIKVRQESPYRDIFISRGPKM